MITFILQRIPFAVQRKLSERYHEKYEKLHLPVAMYAMHGKFAVEIAKHMSVDWRSGPPRCRYMLLRSARFMDFVTSCRSRLCEMRKPRPYSGGMALFQCCAGSAKMDKIKRRGKTMSNFVDIALWHASGGRD